MFCYPFQINISWCLKLLTSQSKNLHIKCNVNMKTSSRLSTVKLSYNIATNSIIVIKSLISAIPKDVKDNSRTSIISIPLKKQWFNEIWII